MIRHALPRVLPCLALFVVPALAGCKFETTVVGDDDAGTVADSGKAGQDAGCTIYPPCAGIELPVGCTWSTPTCGSCHQKTFSCPEPVCLDGGAVDAGAADGGCTIYPPCVGVDLPPGCTWGAATCNPATKTFSCPEPVCPDSGTAGSACVAAGGTCTGTGGVACANKAPDADQDCNPDLNPAGSFCCLDAAKDAGTCVDIALSSYDLSCTQTSDCIPIYAGQLCDGNCACPNATVNASGQSQYEQAISGLTLGICGCPASSPPSASQASASSRGQGKAWTPGTPFACGTKGLTCDPATQYCYIVEGGPISPDGGTAVSASCETIPTQCVNDGPIVAAVCACIAASQSLQPSACTNNGAGGMTVTLEAP